MDGFDKTRAFGEGFGATVCAGHAGSPRKPWSESERAMDGPFRPRKPSPEISFHEISGLGVCPIEKIQLTSVSETARPRF